MTAPRTDAAGPHTAAVADDALHGSYCPKMCSFACPVTSATGRDDAVPWSFHRTVSDLAAGRLPLVPAVAGRLTACSGCLACQVPCAFDQDVPAQVRAGRAALVDAGAAPVLVADAVAAVDAGRAPTGTDLPELPASEDEAGTVIVAGCRDDSASLHAAVALLRAAGERVAVRVPEGCCGALLDDLGARDAADRARTRVADLVPATAETVVANDPHCLGSLRAAGIETTDLATHLGTAVADGRLTFTAGDERSVTWHDPCVLARGEGVTDAPRRLLTAAGASLVEPEHHARHTACSGAGMGMDQLDPDAADATADARVRELGAGPVVTGCARAAERLRARGADVTDLASALVTHLAGSPSSPSDPERRSP
ncbi:MAG: (Fe-S)-binding protein [Nitriliruptor sp.]